MSNKTHPTSLPPSNSAGSVGSDHRHLDSHYLLAKAEYESCIASVGIQPGWRVLDAGCGTGTFLPYIADLVGPTGTVVALDHAAESIDHVRAWVESDRPTAQFETHVGPLHALPFPDASLDCIWNANVVIYMKEEDDFQKMMSEFARVLKPGGLLAVKETDYDLGHVHPIPSALYRRQIIARGVAHRFARIQQFGAHLRAHGLRVLKSASTLVERVAPFHPDWIPFLVSMQHILAGLSRDCDLSAEDRAAWADIDAHIETMLAGPDARYREIFMLFVGQKPT